MPVKKEAKFGGGLLGLLLIGWLVRTAFVMIQNVDTQDEHDQQTKDAIRLEMQAMQKQADVWSARIAHSTQPTTATTQP